MINVTFDPPNWVDINRGKLNRLILLAAYQVNESSGALIDKLEARNEGRKPKAKRAKRSSA
jgi:hypothetical protein